MRISAFLFNSRITFFQSLEAFLPMGGNTLSEVWKRSFLLVEG